MSRTRVLLCWFLTVGTIAQLAQVSVLIVIGPAVAASTVFIAQIRFKLTFFFSLSAASLVADAEVMYVVSEVIGEVPGLMEQQFCVWVSHTSLLSSILTHCSVAEEKHVEATKLLHSMMVNSH